MRWSYFLALFLAPLVFSGCARGAPTPTAAPAPARDTTPTPGATAVPTAEETPTLPPVRITIVFDNNPYDDRLTTAWGFGCVVHLPKKTILFDTGGSGSILLRNMALLGIDPKEIDAVVLSHIHGDHVGGLDSFLERNSDVVVYIPASFPKSLKERVRRSGARLDEVHQARELFTGVFTTGELNGGIREQSLVVMTSQGLVVITGCAHPGVVNVVRNAKEIGGDKICLVLGGFHLGGMSEVGIRSIVEDFVEMGVETVAPCHCSGDLARSLFRERYGQNYIYSGAGKEVTIPYSTSSETSNPSVVPQRRAALRTAGS